MSKDLAEVIESLVSSGRLSMEVYDMPVNDAMQKIGEVTSQLNLAEWLVVWSALMSISEAGNND